MTISTLKPQSTSNVKAKLIYLVLFILAGVLFFYFGRGLVSNMTSLGGKSTLSVSLDNTNNKAKVFVDDEFVGDTPFTSQTIKTGDRKVSIRSESTSYEKLIKFLPNSRVDLVRNLGVSPTFSSGTDLWFDEKEGGTVLRIVTDPEGASVFIDNNSVGKAPYSSTNITPGDYDIRVEHPGYQPISIRVTTSEKATLNLSFTLFPIPVPSKVSLLTDSTNMYDLSLTDAVITADTAMWAKAVVFWNTSSGINISGVGVNKEKVFDYFVDYKGNIFDALGTMVPQANVKTLKDLEKGGYLGRKSDTPGLTPEAKDALKLLNVSVTKSAKVKGTPAGWLRVRADASLTAAELARVNENETYPVLEEKAGWVKITVSDKIQGWVSSSYVEILGGEKTAEPKE
ncbi:MAG: hypothetical protein RLY61_329 [Candidatus Parcubacteria bacterium]|jgi:hypothetical protein